MLLSAFFPPLACRIAFFAYRKAKGDLLVPPALLAPCGCAVCKSHSLLASAQRMHAYMQGPSSLKFNLAREAGGLMATGHGTLQQHIGHTMIEGFIDCTNAAHDVLPAGCTRWPADECEMSATATACAVQQGMTST